MKTLLISSFLLLFTISSFAQSISGTITDENNDPVYYATVALYNAADSSYVKAESTDFVGKYTFSKVESGSYYMNVNMLGYKDVIQSDVNLGNQDLTFDINLVNDAQLLDAIEIKEQTTSTRAKSR